jgi:two-component system, OmpR family, KDP operon response regulator KdpE
VLSALLSRMGSVVPSAELLAAGWGNRPQRDEQYLRQYIRYLRCKIERDPRSPRYIVNEHGDPDRQASRPRLRDLRAG